MYLVAILSSYRMKIWAVFWFGPFIPFCLFKFCLRFTVTNKNSKFFCFIWKNVTFFLGMTCVWSSHKILRSWFLVGTRFLSFRISLSFCFGHWNTSCQEHSFSSFINDLTCHIDLVGFIAHSKVVFVVLLSLIKIFVLAPEN